MRISMCSGCKRTFLKGWTIKPPSRRRNPVALLILETKDAIQEKCQLDRVTEVVTTTRSVTSRGFISPSQRQGVFDLK